LIHQEANAQRFQGKQPESTQMEAVMTTPISGVSPHVRVDTYTGASGARMPASAKMASLFDRIDSSGAGVITRSQFNNAFQTMQPPGDFKTRGADAIWSTLTSRQSNSIAKNDFVTGMLAQMRSMRAPSP
jgi:hypothetical protein